MVSTNYLMIFVIVIFNFHQLCTPLRLHTKELLTDNCPCKGAVFYVDCIKNTDWPDLKNLPTGAKCVRAEHDYPVLNDIGMNKIISAFYLPPWSNLTLWEGENYTGKSMSVVSNMGPILVGCLTADQYKFNDAASSLKVREYPPKINGAFFFVDCFFGEFDIRNLPDSKTFYTKGSSVSDLSQSTTFNDMFSAIYIGPNLKVEVFENKDFGGDKREYITGDTPKLIKCLVDDNFNDKISSLKITDLSVSK
jgi:hypothetical protein